MGSGREAEVYSGTVEESLHLDVNRFEREGIIRGQCQTSGIISWDRPIWNKPSIGFEIQCFMENGYMRLQYAVTSLVLSYIFKPYTSTFSVKFFKVNFPKGENEKCPLALSMVVFETRTAPPVA